MRILLRADKDIEEVGQPVINVFALPTVKLPNETIVVNEAPTETAFEMLINI
tara:strand:- start:21 stop:176 length:156 start_codon:yes stop_codon:yes gene_type:complete